jgi:hypothetical protein
MSWLFEKDDPCDRVDSAFTWGACTQVITATLNLLKDNGFNVSQYEIDWTQYYEGFSVQDDNLRTKVVIKVGDVGVKRYEILVIRESPAEQLPERRRFRATDGPNTLVTAQYLSEKVAEMIRGN